MIALRFVFLKYQGWQHRAELAKEVAGLEKPRIIVAAVILLSIWISSASYAQQKTIKDGVYTDAQVAAGKSSYETSCKGCHDLKFYRDIWPAWEEKALLNFWYTIMAEMPADNPGSLFDEEYTNVVANILSEMGFPSGDTELELADDMDEIKIVMP